MNQIYLQSSQHPPLPQSSEVKSVECEAVSFQLSTNTFQLPPLLHTNPAARVPSVKPTKLPVNDPGSAIPPSAYVFSAPSLTCL